jgi:Zn-dependent protease/CBS domain-containing protein
MKVGRISGIQIDVHPSWLVVFVLVTLTLGLGVFPAWHPDWPATLTWSVAIAAALLFFASILVHELAHSLVARARGVPVRRITLFMFGGVSNIEREPRSAADEFMITIVGPFTSFLLGFAFLWLGGLLAGDALGEGTNPWDAFGRLGPLATLLTWLGPVNILVALFNLVPGFPLDGGRLLRAALWAMTGDIAVATRWAAGVGQVVAGTFIVAGFAMALGVRVPLLGVGLPNGLWIALIGWFLHQAAGASYRHVALQSALQDVPVSRLMRREVRAVSPETTVRELVDDWMLGTDDRAFPVMEGERLVGVVAIEHVREVPRERRDLVTVGSIMTPERELEVIGAQVDAGDALRALVRSGVNQLPVVDHGRFAGMLRRADILRWVELRSEFAR